MLAARRLLKAPHDRMRLSVSYLIETTRIHRVVLDLGLHSLRTGLRQSIRRFDARLPRIRGRDLAQTVELAQQRGHMAIFGFDDVHERTHRPKTFDHLAICGARLVFVLQSLRKRFNRSPISHTRLHSLGLAESRGFRTLSVVDPP